MAPIAPVPFPWIEIGLAFVAGLSGGIAVGAVVMSRYFRRRADTREPIVINQERFVVMREPAYFELCRASRKPPFPAAKPRRWQG